MKKLICLLLACTLLFTACSKPTTRISDELAEQEILAFYDRYIEQDDFNYLLYVNYETMLEKGVPFYILDRWGAEKTTFFLANIESGAVNLEDYANENEIETLMSYIDIGTQINVYKTSEIQALMDTMFGAGIIDVESWPTSSERTFTEAGYMVSIFYAAGFYDYNWFEVGEIVFDGEYATLPVYGISYYEYSEVLADLSEKAYQIYPGYDDYYLMPLLLVEDLNIYIEMGEPMPSFDEMLELAGIEKDALGTINLVFKITDTGVYLTSFGPFINTEMPVEESAVA